MSNIQNEIRLAQQALDAGDVRHAAHHAAAAIFEDPLHERALALIDRLVAQPAPGFGASLKRFFGASEPMAPLFPDDGFAGNVAARARAHWKRGELQAAFDLVVNVAFAVPDRPFVQWALEIAALAAEREIALDPRVYFTAYSELGRATMGLLHLRPGEQRFFAPWAELGRRVAATSRSTDAALAFATSSIERRAGWYERALETVAPVQHEPIEHVHTTRGFVLRALGRWNEARRAFESAARYSAGFPYELELARVAWDAGERHESRRLFTHAAGDDSENTLAVEVLDELLAPERERYWTRILGDAPTYDAVRRVMLGRELYPPMSDASTNVLPQLEGPPPIQVRMGTSCAECPSVLATLALRVTGTSDPRGIEYSTGDVPSPSPYEPLDRARGLRLWESHGSVAAQTIDLPPPEVQALVDDLVRSLWARKQPERMPVLGLTRAWTIAQRTAGLDEIEPMDVIATMVHPPRPDDWRDTVAWVFDRQVVSAMLLAAQDRDVPWLRSRRRESLRGLVLGHPDWTQAAALYALAQVVRDEPDALEDAREWAAHLLDAQPDKGHVPWADALRSLLLVPGMPSYDVARIVSLDDGNHDNAD